MQVCCSPGPRTGPRPGRIGLSCCPCCPDSCPGSSHWMSCSAGRVALLCRRQALPSEPGHLCCLSYLTPSCCCACNPWHAAPRLHHPAKPETQMHPGSEMQSTDEMHPGSTLVAWDSDALWKQDAIYRRNALQTECTLEAPWKPETQMHPGSTL